MKRRILVISLACLTLLAIIYFSPWRPMLPGYHAFSFRPEEYNKLKKKHQSNRQALKAKYKKVQTDAERKKIFALAEKQFIGDMEKEFQFWYGTRWNFNGVTRTPGEGSIACGYFVTTTLQDAGVKLNRIKIAQCASEDIVKHLSSKQNIRRFSNIALSKFIEEVKQMGSGLYVVGLDNHVGFLLCQNKQVYFIHSSGFLPLCVVREPAEYSWSLSHSQYRVVGHLSKDKAFMAKWLHL